MTKLSKRPFALLGVNCERTDNPSKLKADLATHKINWRSFKNKRAGAEGTIASNYQVKGYPSLFLIDHKGVIREIWVGNPGAAVIDAKVEQLIKEAEAAKRQEKK